MGDSNDNIPAFRLRLDREKIVMRKQVELSSSPICSICLEPLCGIDEISLSEKEIVTWQGCGHTFHSTCANRVVHKAKLTACLRCPYCSSRDAICKKVCDFDVQCVRSIRKHIPFQRIFLDTEQPGETEILPLRIKIQGSTKAILNVAAAAVYLSENVESLISQLENLPQVIRLPLDSVDTGHAIDGSLESVTDQIESVISRFTKAKVEHGCETADHDLHRSLNLIKSMFEKVHNVTKLKKAEDVLTESKNKSTAMLEEYRKDIRQADDQLRQTHDEIKKITADHYQNLHTVAVRRQVDAVTRGYLAERGCLLSMILSLEGRLKRLEPCQSSISQPVYHDQQKSEPTGTGAHSQTTTLVEPLEIVYRSSDTEQTEEDSMKMAFTIIVRGFNDETITYTFSTLAGLTAALPWISTTFNSQDPQSSSQSSTENPQSQSIHPPAHRAFQPRIRALPAIKRVREVREMR